MGKLVLEIFKYLSWTYYIYYFETNKALESKSAMINSVDTKMDCTVNILFNDRTNFKISVTEKRARYKIRKY